MTFPTSEPGVAADDVYQALTEDNDARWGFGMGFDDPLGGLDAAVPRGIDGRELAAYCLMLADDALVLSHRLQEWCTCAPELEDEVALANIGLDLLGQARLLLARAGQADGSGRSEDELAFWRREGEMGNVRLVEVADGHFGHLVARLLVIATWRLAVFGRLVAHADPVLAAIAGRAVHELAYHRDYAAQWVVRLGDGTDLSHRRVQAGLDAAWPYVEELFDAHPIERRVGVDPSLDREEFDDVVGRVVDAATLELPASAAVLGVGGRTGRHGVHTEAMGPLLAELQSLARAHPGARW